MYLITSVVEISLRPSLGAAEDRLVAVLVVIRVELEGGEHLRQFFHARGCQLDLRRLLTRRLLRRDRLHSAVS